MTNFQAQQLTSAKWLTPERYVTFLPSFVGASISFFIVAFVLIPMVFGVLDRWEDVLIMEAQVNELPSLRQQIDTEQAKLKQLRHQETLLFELVASKEELKTYLAQLNKLMLIHQLSVVELKPEVVESYLPPKLQDSESSLSATNSEASDSDDLVVSEDPLLVSGIERHSINLVVDGAFTNLLALLRDLESLSVIMIPSDLELVQASTNPSDLPSDLSRLQMSLILTGYGRSPL